MSRRKIVVAVTVTIIAAVILVMGLLTVNPPGNYLGDFFFFQDPEFLNGLGSDEIKWEGSSWNFSSNFISDVNIQGGLATLFYNESSGNEWGGAVLVQGKLPHNWGNYLQPLEGTTKTNAKPVEYITFELKSQIPQGKFLLKVKVMVRERTTQQRPRAIHQIRALYHQVRTIGTIISH